jgi:hypothetical protein
MLRIKREPVKAGFKASWPARLASAIRRIRRGDWHWFDHPEMQARVQKAEADRLEGRVEKLDSREAALARLDSLA